MTTQTLNSLSRAASAYLRSAMHQPIQWHEWGEEAFDLAKRENKPMLLDIGAVWCHWCHVMDRESYDNPEVAQIINQRFIPIKVDRDERPDIDSRYQAAVSALTGQGGWPLTAFLTPDGKPFYGGTYFPPDDHWGRPGFKRVLVAIANAFQQKREEVAEQAGMVESAISGRVPHRTEREIQSRRGRRNREIGAGHVRSRPRRLRTSSEVPSSGGSRFADRAVLPFARRSASQRFCHHARKDGQRRRLRPACRRVPPIFRGRALGRPAL